MALEDLIFILVLTTYFGMLATERLWPARKFPSVPWWTTLGVAFLVPCGTTGESPVLTDDERLSLFAAVAEAVTIPVIAGTGTNDTAHSVHMTKEATKLGVAGILAVTPYYNRPPQSGIEGHMRAMAASTSSRTRSFTAPSFSAVASAALSMPKPAQADIKCSTVYTFTPPLEMVEAKRVSVTAVAVIGISTGCGKSTRRNTMPVSGCAGRSVSSTRCPLWRPTPTALVSD